MDINNESYMCFCHREIKSAPKTHASQATSFHKFPLLSMKDDGESLHDKERMVRKPKIKAIRYADLSLSLNQVT